MPHQATILTMDNQDPQVGQKKNALELSTVYTYMLFTYCIPMNKILGSGSTGHRLHMLYPASSLVTKGQRNLMARTCRHIWIWGQA